MRLKLLVLNPNASQPMTDAVTASMGALVPDSVQVIGWTARSGPPVIKDRATYDQAASCMPELLAAAPKADGILLACFGDPGLHYLRGAAPVPVVGLADAAFSYERRKAQRFAIITAGVAWIPILRECAIDAGVSPLLVDVFALTGDGAMLRSNPERFREEVMRSSVQAMARGARRIILGGAAFEGLEFSLADGLQLDWPVGLATASLASSMGFRAKSAVME